MDGILPVPRCRPGDVNIAFAMLGWLDGMDDFHLRSDDFHLRSDDFHLRSDDFHLRSDDCHSRPWN